MPIAQKSGVRTAVLTVCWRWNSSTGAGVHALEVALLREWLEAIHVFASCRLRRRRRVLVIRSLKWHRRRRRRRLAWRHAPSLRRGSRILSARWLRPRRETVSMTCRRTQVTAPRGPFPHAGSTSPGSAQHTQTTLLRAGVVPGAAWREREKERFFENFG